jgi:hypothetical protein
MKSTSKEVPTQSPSEFVVLSRKMCHLIVFRILHCILNLLMSSSFYDTYVQLPNADTLLASEIQDNPKLYPFFKDCIGSIDGTHLDAFVPDNAVACYQNWKGRLSQNVLAACSQDMHFTYILKLRGTPKASDTSRWEGSASDGHIFDDA